MWNLATSTESLGSSIKKSFPLAVCSIVACNSSHSLKAVYHFKKKTTTLCMFMLTSHYNELFAGVELNHGLNEGGPSALKSKEEWKCHFLLFPLFVFSVCVLFPCSELFAARCVASAHRHGLSGAAVPKPPHPRHTPVKPQIRAVTRTRSL